MEIGEEGRGMGEITYSHPKLLRQRINLCVFEQLVACVVGDRNRRVGLKVP